MGDSSGGCFDSLGEGERNRERERENEIDLTYKMD